MPREKFTKVFRDRLDDIEREAKSLSSSMTEICRRTGISRATPDRYRARPPKTIEVLDEMESALEDIRKGVPPSKAKAKKKAKTSAKRTPAKR